MRTPNVDTLCPLSPLQHAMLHATRQEPGAGLYVEQFSCVLVGALEVDAFRAAWQSVVDRHDALKTLFLRLDTARPLQVVRKSVVLPFVVDDWTTDGVPASGESERFADLLAQDRRAGFDPALAPLMRVRVVRTAPDRHRFLWTYHHAILDGWSMPVLLREVFDRLAAPDRVVPPTRTDYRHYLAWLMQQDVERSLEFWRVRLRGLRAPVRFAPAVVPTEARSDDSRRFGSRHVALSPAWADGAATRCRAARITLNTLCQAAWALLLAHYGNTDDVVHGLVVSGRTADVPGIERMVGLFIATLPARAVLDRDEPASAWLRRLQADTQELERHATAPLARVLSCADIPRAQALFDTLYVFENYPGQSAFDALVRSRGLRVEDVRAVEETGYGLVLIALPAEGLKLQLTYDRSKFGAAAVDELLGSYRHLLDRLLAMADAPLGTVFAGMADRAAPDAGAAVAPPGQVMVAAAQTMTTIAPGPTTGPLLRHGDRVVDQASFARAVARGRIAWARLDARPGERILLRAGAEPISDLVALMAGAESGLEIVLAEPHLGLDEAHACALQAFGAGAALRCVAVLGDSRSSLQGGSVHCERLALDDAAAEGASPSPNEHAAGGAVTWIVRTAQRESMAVRHEFADLVALARTCGPVPDRVALSTTDWRPAALTAILRARHAGSSVALFAAGHTPRELAGWWRTLALAETGWDELRLDPAQTRALAASASVLEQDGQPLPRVPTACWVVDAASLTAGGAQVLARLAPGARTHRVLGDGLAGCVVATAPCNDALIAEDAHALRVVGVDGEPVAPHALGRLAVAGPAVAAAVWRRGRPDRTQRIVTKNGPLLLLRHVAWRGPRGLATSLPDPAAALHGDCAPHDALEQALAAVEGVQELAVATHLGDDGEWSLLVHAVADDIEGLRGVAAAAGAAQGAPLVLELVARLPRDKDGRVDRLALDRGDVERLRGAAPMAPRDATESALHAIWCTLLQRERIGIHEDYFDLGGDSILATVMLAQVQAATGTLVEIGALLQAPTIAGLARTLRDGTGAFEDVAVTLARDAGQPLDLAIAEARTPELPAQGHDADARSPRPVPANVLLTGATGFLGVHLLAELLATTTARVHCLVRAADAPAGHERLVQALKANELWEHAHAARIAAIPGDLGPARFGLPVEAFEALAREIDTIYHNGAAVNFVLPYGRLKPVNIDATDEVLRLASLHRIKPVHYISTVGVLDRAADSLPELLAIPLHDRLMGGYEQSKWVAEQRVCMAGERGLPVTIYRPSRIVGHSKTGRSNVDDLFFRLIRGVVLQGQAPYSPGYDNMLAVDHVARLIVEASAHPGAAGRAVHVVNPRSHAFDALIDFIAARGHRIERLAYGEWLEAVAGAAKDRPDHPLAPLLPVLRQLDASKDPTLARAMPLAHANLAQFAPAAFAAIAPCEEWLSVMFEYLYATATLPRPAVEAVA